MTSLIPRNKKTREQEELDGKRRLLDELEAELASRQLEYSTLAGEIDAFRNRYYLRVGILYARLDALRAEIAELVAARNQGDATAQEDARKARERARETFEEANSAVEEEPVSFQPSADLKKLFREAARLIHPDRALNEEDRLLRDRLMSEVNVAYRKGDADRIAEILERYRDRLNPLETDDIGAQLVRIIRSIARTRDHIANLTQAIAELRESEWFKLKSEVEAGEARGEDPLGQLAEKIHRETLAEQERLKELRRAPVAGGQSTPAEAPAAPAEPSPVEPESPAAAYRPEGRIHRTERGEKVRSKSEAIIANILNGLGVDYRYEYPIEGHREPGVRRPDFVVFDNAQRPIIWEHLGMMDDPGYRARWEAKLAWYEANGFTQGVDLFVTCEEADGGLDSQWLRRVADNIRTLAAA